MHVQWMVRYWPNVMRRFSFIASRLVSKIALTFVIVSAHSDMKAYGPSPIAFSCLAFSFACHLSEWNACSRKGRWSRQHACLHESESEPPSPAGRLLA